MSPVAGATLLVMNEPIPVTVITGFLGAGKSTLLQRWLGELPPEGTAVIINEQGEVGIDGELLSERAAQLREITGGCICCRAQSELDDALTTFAGSSPPPQRILVETSGGASPAGVLRALTWGSARDQLRLDGVVTVLDASRADRVLAFDLTTEQLAFADVVVLSHADSIDETDLASLEQRLGPRAPGAVFTRGRSGVLDEDLPSLLARRSDALRVPVDAHGHDRAHGIDAVSMVLDAELDDDRFAAWVEDALGPQQARILRVKGILAVRGVEQRVIVQGVGDAVQVTLGSAWGDTSRSSRMVVLGLELDAPALQRGFETCRAHAARA